MHVRRHFHGMQLLRAAFHLLPAWPANLGPGAPLVAGRRAGLTAAEMPSLSCSSCPIMKPMASSKANSTV